MAKIHILAIAGTMTAPLAIELKRLGHTVTGSDQQRIYPPISTLLSKNNIPLNPKINFKSIDQFIIGSSYKSFTNTKSEFDQIKKQKLAFISATKYIAQNIIKSNSILVAGSFGKSSITSLLSWILIQNKLNPSFMFGAQAINSIPSLKITNSSWSVVEADESINGLDKKAKFLYYPVKYLILTSANWEHKESYSTAQKNFQTFKKLVKKLPKNGLLITNLKDSNCQKLSSFSKAPVLSYDSSGNYLQQNISAVKTLCSSLNINSSAIANYKGLKRRLELLDKKNNILFYDDFAQSAPRIKSTLQVLYSQYPKHKIFCLLDPHASFLKNKSGLNNLKQAFNKASVVILTKINFNHKIAKDNRATSADFKKEIGSKLTYLPLLNQQINFFKKNISPNSIVIRFSSGGLSSLNNYKHLIKSI